MRSEEQTPFLDATTEYPVWTPLPALGAAEPLLDLLEKHKAAPARRLLVSADGYVQKGMFLLRDWAGAI